MFNKFATIRSEKGTALIVALLIMSVLVAISLALASLIFKEVKVTRDLINAGKAYHMAEGGVEMALYDLNDNLPGMEKIDAPDEIADSWSEVDVDAGSQFRYEIKNQCSSYPCLEEVDVDTFDSGSVDPANQIEKAFYDVLPLNQTITIPLFVVDKDPITGIDNVVSINDFTVEYFAKFTKDQLRVENASGWDVLRWKIFGMRRLDIDDYVTESISDFVPVTAVSGSSGLSETGPTMPSWFGTSGNPCNIKYVPDTYPIQCFQYATDWFASETQEVCASQNTSARDHYKYTWTGSQKYLEDEDIKACYPISEFITEHAATVPNNSSDFNTGLIYLTLTNMMNPSMFETGTLKEREDLSAIYFRVEVGDPQRIVREYADITADGVSGDSIQSINVKIKRNSYMPVFNFAVYSTFGKESYYNEYMTTP